VKSRWKFVHVVYQRWFSGHRRPPAAGIPQYRTTGTLQGEVPGHPQPHVLVDFVFFEWYQRVVRLMRNTFHETLIDDFCLFRCSFDSAKTFQFVLDVSFLDVKLLWIICSFNKNKIDARQIIKW